MIAIGNSNVRALAAVAAERLDDDAPLVRGAAIWALARLSSREELSSFAAARVAKETDATVIEEWRVAVAAPLKLSPFLTPPQARDRRGGPRLSAKAQSPPDV